MITTRLAHSTVTYASKWKPGSDGIGKEVVPAAIRVLESLTDQHNKRSSTEDQITFHFKEVEAGFGTFQKRGTALPEDSLEQLRTCDGALFGSVESPTHKVEGYSSPILGMRKALDLYANLRPIVSSPLDLSKSGVDFLIVRENTEELYVKKERLEDGGKTAIADRIITERASLRIAKMAFEQAKKRGGKNGKKPKVTIVHKSNVLSLTDGLFRTCCFQVAKQYPDIEAEEQIVDSMAYKMIIAPEKYDVVVAPNLYGDILSDAAAALVGGLGIVPSANVGDNFALCEPVHGSAPDIAGKGIANPIATIRAAALLLQHLKGGDISIMMPLSQKIEAAVFKTLKDGPHTPDLGGGANTEVVTDAVIKNLAQQF